MRCEPKRTAVFLFNKQQRRQGCPSWRADTCTRRGAASCVQLLNDPTVRPCVLRMTTPGTSETPAHIISTKRHGATTKKCATARNRAEHPVWPLHEQTKCARRNASVSLTLLTPKTDVSVFIKPLLSESPRLVYFRITHQVLMFKKYSYTIRV